MKKLFFLFLAAILMFGCKKDDPVKPPDPPKPPLKTRIHITGNFDFQPGFAITSCHVGLILFRDGANVIDGFTLFDASPNFSVNLNESLDSLKGKTYDVLFSSGYQEDGMSYPACIIKPVTFGDTVNLGNIGFSNYVWNGNPRLELVILPSGEKFYAPPHKK